VLPTLPLELGDARLREALDAMPHKVWMVRLDGPALYYNRAMRDFAGSAIHLSDRASRERALVHADDLPRFIIMRDEALASDRDWSVEVRLRCPDGDYRWHQLHFALLRTAGEAKAWLVAATDIDDVQQALIAAEESEARLRLAASAANLGIYVFDLETQRQDWSPELKKIFGLAPDAGAPGNMLEWIHPDDRERFRALREQSFDAAGTGLFQDEHRIVRSDGAVRWVYVKGRVSFSGAGQVRKPKGGIGLVLDITERKLAEQALTQGEARYRTLFESANDIVVTLELDGRIISINPVVRDILGFEPEEMIGQPLADFVSGEQIAMQQEMLQRKLDGANATQYDLKMAAKDGALRILGVNSRLVFDAKGQPSMIHSVARDVTERKEAEARQVLLIRELQHRTKNLLAVIQAIANSTLKGSAGLETFIGRLHALANAQEYVTAGSQGGVSIRALLEAELATFGKRAAAQGQDLVLGGGFAQSFALIVHELATNAVKHGAFSTSQGRVNIEWGSDQRYGQALLNFSWIERDGPLVQPPASQGFGTQLISAVGKSRIEFRPEGFEYRLIVPFSEALRGSQ
jgi:PAS domain S-box-containing protein